MFGIRDGSDEYQCLGVYPLDPQVLQYAPSQEVMQDFVRAFVPELPPLQNPEPHMQILKSINFTDRNNPPPIIERDEHSGEELGRSGELEIKINDLDSEEDGGNGGPGPGPGPNGGNGGPGLDDDVIEVDDDDYEWCRRT